MARVSPEEFPDPVVDAALADKTGQSRAILAGGCFWCVEAVYKNLDGVSSVKSGYAGGTADTADYETVSSGTTDHAESVEVVYDPSRISYGQILKVFFAIAHDTTQLNRQGPDTGRQYRSAIFYSDDEVRAQITASRGLGRWTADMFLLINLERPDILPIGDLGIRSAVQRLYRLDHLPTPREVDAIGEKWRPHRSLASLYLWASTRQAPKPTA